MKYHKIKGTGVEIPAIIFGTSALGNLYTALPFETKKEIVSESIKHVQKNVVFDSAGKYGAGLALEMLGKILGELDENPKNILISNKLGWLRAPLKGNEPTFEKGVWMDLKNDAIQDISYDGIMRCFEQGNELLSGYKPQLVSVHDPDEYLAESADHNDRKKRLNDIVQAYRALHELKEQGLVQAIGIGAKDWNVIQELEHQIKLDWVMFANSLTIMHHPPELLGFMELLNKKGIAIINSAVFHAGFLTGGNYFDYRLIKPDTEENRRIFKWREIFFELCSEFNIKPADACVNFAMTPPGVVSISLNTSNPNRVKDNVSSVIKEVPVQFYQEMVEKELISREFPYLNR